MKSLFSKHPDESYIKEKGFILLTLLGYNLSLRGSRVSRDLKQLVT